jgi:hypothetical protein
VRSRLTRKNHGGDQGDEGRECCADFVRRPGHVESSTARDVGKKTILDIVRTYVGQRKTEPCTSVGLCTSTNSRGGDILVVQNPINPGKLVQVTVPKDYVIGGLFWSSLSNCVAVRRVPAWSSCC